MPRRRRCGGTTPYVGGRRRRCGRGMRPMTKPFFQHMSKNPQGEGLGDVFKGAIKIGKKALPWIKKIFSKGKKAYSTAQKFAKENPELVSTAKDLGKKGLDAIIKQRKGKQTATPGPNPNVLPVGPSNVSQPTNPFMKDDEQTAKNKMNPFHPSFDPDYKKYGGRRKRRRGRPCTYSKGRGVKPRSVKFGGNALMRGPIA